MVKRQRQEFSVAGGDVPTAEGLDTGHHRLYSSRQHHSTRLLPHRQRRPYDPARRHVAALVVLERLVPIGRCGCVFHCRSAAASRGFCAVRVVGLNTVASVKFNDAGLM